MRQRGGEVTASGACVREEMRQEDTVSVKTKERETGGWQNVADALTKAGFGNVTRQAVYAWWRRRNKTGFPAGELVNGRRKFDIASTLVWRLNYVPNKGGRPRKKSKVDA